MHPGMGHRQQFLQTLGMKVRGDDKPRLMFAFTKVSAPDTQCVQRQPVLPTTHHQKSHPAAQEFSFECLIFILSPLNKKKNQDRTYFSFVS